MYKMIGDYDKKCGNDFFSNLHTEKENWKNTLNIQSINENYKKINKNKFKKEISSILKPSMFNNVFSSSLINELEDKYDIELDKETKGVLDNNFNDLLALKKIYNNSIILNFVDFKFESIEYTQDPEEPDINTLTIYISINEKEIDKLIKLRDIVIEELCKDIPIETLKKLSIVNIV